MANGSTVHTPLTPHERQRQQSAQNGRIKLVIFHIFPAAAGGAPAAATADKSWHSHGPACRLNYHTDKNAYARLSTVSVFDKGNPHTEARISVNRSERSKRTYVESSLRKALILSALKDGER